METLVVVAHHRNHGYTRSKAQIIDRLGSSFSMGFKGINCRTFQSIDSSLPISPSFFPSHAHGSESKRAVFGSEHPKLSRSNPISINPKQSPKLSTFCEELSCSELWAGPTYSISPPPSSLPIPKFSLCQKRRISLDLTDSRSGLSFQHEAKSAPASPVRGVRGPGSPYTDFLLSTASATENLRRILNLDLVN